MIPILDIFLHLDKYLGSLISQYGTFVYLLLFITILIETGLVIMPFLPGDSLLFAAGAFAAIGSLNIFSLLILLSIAAILGDTINYWLGYHFGRKVFMRYINPKYLQATEEFYHKHGGKTVILARFVPIIRTFAPFVAGTGSMNYPKFLSFNIIGGIAWVLLFTLVGFFFGNIQFVKDNFSLVILALIATSILPIIYEYIKHHFRK